MLIVTSSWVPVKRVWSWLRRCYEAGDCVVVASATQWVTEKPPPGADAAADSAQPIRMARVQNDRLCGDV
jgi:hypothetical protein